jgi:hypothetical protein
VTRWALEGATNPTVLRLHVDVELTAATIATSPPDEPPPPLDRLFEIESIRSLDLHRYQARLNLRPDATRALTAAQVSEVLHVAWGAPSHLEPDDGPRAFATRTSAPRRVAESPEMAEGDPLLEAVLAVDGVAEAIVGEGLVLVRLGRMFAWAEIEPAVRSALRSAQA